MPVVYIKEQRAVVRKRGGRMLVEKEGQCLLEIPLRSTTAVALFGNVQVTTQALSEMLDRGIPLALYTRNGRLKGHLAPEASKNIPLRMAQYRMASDAAASLRIARAIVSAKLHNSAALIMTHRSNHPSTLLDETAAGLKESAEEAERAESFESLLGVEGAGAAAYFKAFAEMNRSELPFDGRVKHPPRDPVNALLSLGYTMVMNELRSAAEGAGLEPHLGFLHKVDYGRPSLALDLLEPFRAPVVDRLTLRVINQRILTAEDFGKRPIGPMEGSVILAPGAWTRYIGEYERCMTEAHGGLVGVMRERMHEELEKLARGLQPGASFVPFRMDGCCT